MDSLGYGANILGPSVGAFADLEKDGIIKTFVDFKELSSIIESNLKADSLSHQKNLDHFLVNHTWDKFANFLQKQLHL